MSKIYTGRGYVYSIEYHIVWCVKYQHNALTSEIERRLREILYKIAEDNKFKITEINIEADHVYITAECSPQHFIPDVIKAVKGVSARLLMKEFGEELSAGQKLHSEHAAEGHTGNSANRYRSFRRYRAKPADIEPVHLWSPSYFIATASEDLESHIKEYIEWQKETQV